ncbi:MAG: hypothetical protein FJ271_32500 [Planctomycetes bacterium]|nr:hypothetical protein [Planctomycetota bacterium]
MTGYRSIEYFQEDIVDELHGATARTVYRQAGLLLEQIRRLDSSLKSGVERRQLYEQFDDIDRQRASLVDPIEALGANGRTLKRGTERINALVDELHYVVSAGDSSDDHQQQALKRQVSSLTNAARNLDKTAQFVLGVTPGQEELLADFKKLAATCDLLAKACTKGKDRKVVQEQCARVNRAWNRAVQGLRSLPPGNPCFCCAAPREWTGPTNEFFDC